MQSSKLPIRFVLIPRALAIAALALLPALTPAQTQTQTQTQDDGHASEAARVDGLWCGRGFLSGTRLSLARHDHEFEGTLARGDRSRSIDGRIEGLVLRTSAASAGRAGELVLRLEGDQLRIVTAGGPIALAQGMAFARASGPGC
jgi:hypothetical protein